MAAARTWRRPFYTRTHAHRTDCCLLGTRLQSYRLALSRVEGENESPWRIIYHRIVVGKVRGGLQAAASNI